MHLLQNPCCFGKIRRLEPDAFITKKLFNEYQRRYSYPKVGDILISASGTIGRTVVYDGRPAYYQDSNIIWIDNKGKHITNEFLYYVYQVVNYGTEGSTIQRLYNDVLKRTIFVCPPTKAEQTAIATALSDMDGLIEVQEQLIAKKRAIKQGAMQELLRPKEGWEERLLTKYVQYIHGRAHEQHFDEHGEFVVVNSKFISSEGKVAKYSRQNFCAAKKGDVLTVLSDLPNGKALAKCFLVPIDNKYAVNQRICIWRSKGADPKFLFYMLNRNKYFIGLDDGISQTHILNHHIEKCRISIPIDKTEQTRIARILFDMDSEIEQLESQLAKYRQIKQGMMQDLLTGRKRLV